MINSIGAQGRRYAKWRNKYVRSLSDRYTCTACGCHIEPGQGRVDHLLVRTGVFSHLKFDTDNVRLTCGNHNNIESMGLAERVEYIKILWGQDAYEYALKHTEGMI